MCDRLSNGPKLFKVILRTRNCVALDDVVCDAYPQITWRTLQTELLMSTSMDGIYLPPFLLKLIQSSDQSVNDIINVCLRIDNWNTNFDSRSPKHTESVFTDVIILLSKLYDGETICFGEFLNLDKRLIGKHFTQDAYDQKIQVKSKTLYESVFTILPAPKCKHHTSMSSNEFDKLMTEEYVFVPQNKTEYAQDATTASCGKIIIIQYKNTPTRQARVNELIDIIVKFVDSMQHQLLDKNIKEYHDQGNTMFWIFIKTCDDMRKEQFGLDNLMSHELLKDFTHLKDRIIILDKDSIQRCLPPVCRGHAMFIEQFIKNKSWRQHSLTEIKGIGPKTAAKYEQIGVKTIDDLLELKVQQNLRSKFKGENGFGFSNQTIKRHQQLAQEYGKLFEQRFKQ